MFDQNQETKIMPMNDESEVVDDYRGKVVIDAGHGGYDNGAISYNGILEKDISLTVAKKVQHVLEYYGVEVVMTRESDEVSWEADNIADLNARNYIANTSNADYFVSIHCNSSDEYAYGSEVYVYLEDEASFELANEINEELKLIEELDNREMKDADLNPLHILIYNEIPSCLVEMGFLTNEYDADFMMSEKGMNALAKAISKGILDTLEIEMK